VARVCASRKRHAHHPNTSTYSFRREWRPRRLRGYPTDRHSPAGINLARSNFSTVPPFPSTHFFGPLPHGRGSEGFKLDRFDIACLGISVRADLLSARVIQSAFRIIVRRFVPARVVSLPGVGTVPTVLTRCPSPSPLDRAPHCRPAVEVRFFSPIVGFL